MSELVIECVMDELTSDGPDVTHLVCHCTDDDIAACGLDVSDSPWAPESTDEVPCPLCFTAWDADAPTCPWGCACDECGPANPTP